MNSRSTDELSELARFLLEDLMHRMTLTEISDKTGVSHSTIYLLRKGGKVDVVLLQSILELSGCELVMRRKE